MDNKFIIWRMGDIKKLITLDEMQPFNVLFTSMGKNCPLLRTMIDNNRNYID
ncbi:MAG: hypothetical protein GX640_10930 [Fibrobacter sp.]|nr:hypothetical protein [Fibrobacter sp.]